MKCGGLERRLGENSLSSLAETLCLDFTPASLPIEQRPHPGPQACTSSAAALKTGWRWCSGQHWEARASSAQQPRATSKAHLQGGRALPHRPARDTQPWAAAGPPAPAGGSPHSVAPEPRAQGYPALLVCIPPVAWMVMPLSKQAQFGPSPKTCTQLGCSRGCFCFFSWLFLNGWFLSAMSVQPLLLFLPLWSAFK